MNAVTLSFWTISPPAIHSISNETDVYFFTHILLSNRKCVIEWEEPHDSALYCIQTDGNHMIASGSSYDGVIRMWDKWQTRCVEVRVCKIYLCVGDGHL